METRSRSRTFAVSEPDLSPSGARFRNPQPQPRLLEQGTSARSQAPSLSSLALSSRNPTPTGEGSLAWDPTNLSLAGDRPPRGSRQSRDDCEERLGAYLTADQGALVTEVRLRAELSSLRRLIDVAVTQSRDETIARIPAFIDASESRVHQSVVNTVGADYNRVAIKCVENRSACKTDIAKVQEALKSNKQAILESSRRFDNLVSNMEALSHKQNLLEQRLNDLASAVDTNTTLESTVQALAADQNESIRALSLRIGVLEQRRSELLVSPFSPVSRAHLPSASNTVPGPGGTQLSEVVAPAPPLVRRRTANSPPRIPVHHEAAPLQDRHSRVHRSPDASHRSRRSSDSQGGSQESSALTLRLGRVKRKIRITVDLILKILDSDLDSVSTKAQALEVVNYEVPKMTGLKRSLQDLEREWDHLNDPDDEVGDLLESTFQSILGWEHAISDMQRKFYMHLRPDASLLKRVELKPFSGSPDLDTVYHFLSVFHRLTDMSCDPIDQAELLFSSYLSPEIKGEVFSFKNDLARVEEWLISQYGDLRSIADTRLAKIASMKHPLPTQPAKTHIEYFKTVHQLLIHLESLAQNEKIDQHEIAAIVFNSSWITQLVSRLPEETILEFTKALEREPRIPAPTGKRYFELLRDLIDSTWRQLTTALKIRSAKDLGGTAESRKPARAANVADSSMPSADGSAKASQKSKSAPAGSKKQDGSFCPMHGSSQRLKHTLGECHAFFKASNAQRFDLCKQAKVCFTCLKAECRRVSFNSCITSQLPPELVCGDCRSAQKMRALSVLLCSNSSHSRPTLKVVQDALARYLSPFNQSLGDHLKQQFNLSVMPSLTSKDNSHKSCTQSKSSPVSSSARIPAYDTVSGDYISRPKMIRVESSHDTVYIFQMIRIGGNTGLVFYDSGATGNLVRGDFAERVGFKVLDPQSQLVGALGNTTMWTNYGIYGALLGDEATGVYHNLSFQGITEITNQFPHYDLTPILNEVRSTGNLDPNEPLPSYVGGRSTDILIGLRSSELQPKLLFTLPSGLGVYRCQFRDQNGSSIAFGGPHSAISRVNRSFHKFSVSHVSAYLTQRLALKLEAPWVGQELCLPPTSIPLAFRPSDLQSVYFDATPLTDDDMRLIQPQQEYPPLLLGHDQACSQCAPPAGLLQHSHVELSPTENKGDPPSAGPDPPNASTHCSSGEFEVHKAKIPLDKIRRLMEGDNDPLVSYRCPDCEDCAKCSSSPMLKSSSLRERAEQKLIEASVRIDYSHSKTFVRYPFLSDPVPFFKKHFGGQSSNFGQARQVFLQQCRKGEAEKQGIRGEMQKLLDAGFISPLSQLTDDIRALISNAEVKHFFPWRSVQKPDSQSTPTRLVVDPSMSLLNLNVAKGDPQLSSMFSLLLRSRSRPCLWSADIKKLYNMLHLEPECLPFSLFLYNDSLNSLEEPCIYVLLRAWYGTASTAGQATHALKQLGLDHQASHPLGSKVLLHDSYVDDLLPATMSRKESEEQVRQVNEILARGGMALKFVAHSHEAPPEAASADLQSMTILGYRYTPESDSLSLNLSEINFAKKVRGAKPPNLIPCTSPESIESAIQLLPKLTRRHVVGKCAELFDPLGLFEPFKAMLKRALSCLNSLSWDDPVPEEQYEFWTQQLKLWPELTDIQVPRAVVPPDALYPLQARLICNTDASQNCAGACLYLSFRLDHGGWSSQLLTAKSRLLSFSVPRNELDAIVLGAELSFAVLVSLNLPIQHLLIASDSLVAICWASNERSRHKTFVFNRVLTINRYMKWMRERLADSPVELVHIPGDLNMADILTKGSISLSEVSLASDWQSGLPWMRVEVSEMPLTRFSDISLDKEDAEKFLSETMAADPFLADNPGGTHFCFYPTSSLFGDTIACVVNPTPPGTATPAQFISLSTKSSGDSTSSMLNVENKEFKRFDPSMEHLINAVRFGWRRSTAILSRAAEFGLRLVHRTHLTCSKPTVKELLEVRCVICKLAREQSTLLSPQTGGDQQQESSDVDPPPPVVNFADPSTLQLIAFASRTIVDFYWNIRATYSCKARLPPKDMLQYEEHSLNGILYYKGRLSQDAKISVVDLDMLDLSFLDGNEISFCNPCLMPNTSIFYAYALHVHLHSVPHMGLESTLQEIARRFHPIMPRKILTRILADCAKCKLLRKKVLDHEMAKHATPRFTLAPPFTFIMCDLAQHFMAKTRHSGRQTMKAPALVVCCLLSGAIAIYMLEDWSTASILQALERHGSRYGFPSQIHVDAGSQLKKLSSLSYSIIDLSSSLHSRFQCDLVVAPPKSHSSQGRVERRIGLLRDMLDKLGASGFLMSFLNWETLFHRIANDINNLPISRSAATGCTRPEWTIITPNRLLLGRNNKRSLSGPLILDSSPSAVLDRLKSAQEAWYGLFLKQAHLFVPRSKWFTSDDVAVGDIVLFFLESQLKSTRWHYALVKEVRGHRLILEYTLSPSDTKKLIERSKRDVVRIACEDELDFNTNAHAERVMDSSSTSRKP